MNVEHVPIHRSYCGTRDVSHEACQEHEIYLMLQQCCTDILIERILCIADTAWNATLRSNVDDADAGLGANDQTNNISRRATECMLTESACIGSAAGADDRSSYTW